MKSILFIFVLLISFLASCRSLSYKCISEDGCPNNKGKYISRDGHKDIYEGQLAVPPGFNFEIDRLLPHGFGKMTYGPQSPGTYRIREEGEVYEGFWDWNQFKFPRFYGKGTYTWKNGTITEAEWYDDSALAGSLGKRKFPDGTVITGIWDKKSYLCSGDCTNGTGIKTADMGEWYSKGKFVEGNLSEGLKYTPYFVEEGKFSQNQLSSGTITCTSNKDTCVRYIKFYSFNTNKFSSNQIKIIYKD
ncbi:hypothetical protein EHQ68_18375 [Leptospira congkakensis]|uniref:MORN repeat protein n=1 Tax=Leptospira congkakensis TaxID=2484932 RepID=A0A4Z1AIV4_9LEPT|nr:hypothetical protein [Leptospira congkakensis]TGL84816.1 hypothetical protein EHQ68_18375 [Leptospira congkakensis]TGL92060.1 hypothetical protein EHQ69_08780 [Leptospira congkakensis]TGL96618.1 hypothetical protein EHQ70_08775 [Leptospira congkakensis]